VGEAIIARKGHYLGKRDNRARECQESQGSLRGESPPLLVWDRFSGGLERKQKSHGGGKIFHSPRYNSYGLGGGASKKGPGYLGVVNKKHVDVARARKGESSKEKS